MEYNLYFRLFAGIFQVIVQSVIDLKSYLIFVDVEELLPHQWNKLLIQ